MGPTTRSSRTQTRSNPKPNYTGTAKPKPASSAGIKKRKARRGMRGKKRDASDEAEEEIESEEEETTSKRQKTGGDDGLKQATLEEVVTMGKDNKDSDETEDEDKADEPEAEKAPKKGEKMEIENKSHNGQETVKKDEQTKVDTENPKLEDKQTTTETTKTDESANNIDKSEANPNDTTTEEKHEKKTTQDSKSTSNGQTTDKSEQHNPPSTIQEKGVLYFFTRAKVNLEGEPKDFTDMQRSFIVMRPIPLKDAITSGEIVDEKEKKMRVLALPKKKLLGQGGKFMTFVEKVDMTRDQVKDEVLQSSTYTTATQGEKTNKPAVPLGTAVYAITQNGRDSHLSYVVVNPVSTDSTLTPLQRAFGLDEKGSFHISIKNPKTKSPAGVSINADPGYSDELMQKFETRSWNAVDPRYLDYVNCECLFIGEKQEEHGEGEAEELEKLAEEDEQRIKELMKTKKEGSGDDDAIFKDLALSREEYGEGNKMDFD